MRRRNPQRVSGLDAVGPEGGLRAFGRDDSHRLERIVPAGPSLLLLQREQLPLALDAPPIAGQLAVPAYDAMTRDDDRDVVGGAGSGDGTGCAGTTDRRGDLAIRATFAGRNRPESAPDLLLEATAARVQGHRGMTRAPGRANLREDCFHPFPVSIVRALDVRIRKV